MPAIIRDAQPRLMSFAPDEKMPNTSLPLVIYQGAAEGDHLDELFRETFRANGWAGVWTGAIFGYDHFHSNAHEVVGIVSGRAQLAIGGQSGVKLDVAEGDVLVLPAGLGHRRVRADPDFIAVGAYPRGQEIHDMYTDLSMCTNYREKLNAVPLPEADPIYGTNGPLLGSWTRAA